MPNDNFDDEEVWLELEGGRVGPALPPFVPWSNISVTGSKDEGVRISLLKPIQRMFIGTAGHNAAMQNVPIPTYHDDRFADDQRLLALDESIRKVEDRQLADPGEWCQGWLAGVLAQLQRRRMAILSDL